MKTKRLLLGTFIAGILAVIFGGNTFATAGNTAEISGGKTWNICVDAGASYAGSDFVVNIAKTDFASQIVLGNGDCKSVEMAAGTYAVSLNGTMGADAASYEIANDTLTFSVANSLRKYLNSFGSIAYTVEGSGEESQFELLFSMPGECQFNGNANVSGETCKDGDGNPLTNKKYIDTNVALFSEENAGRDFEVYFTLTDYASTQINQGTLFNAKYENSSMYYPGFTIRTVGTEGESLEITGRLGKDNTNADKANNSIVTADIKDKEVKIVRVGGMVSYSIDGGEMIPFQDYKNFSRYFEQTAVFGASMQTNGNPQRYYDGTIKNIRVYLKKDTTAKIVFDANGGTGTMAAIEDIEVGTDVVLPANTFAKEGAAFDGWNTEADGTGTTYADEATVSVSAAGTLNLYAQWEEIPVGSIEFDANGGTGTMATIESIELNTEVVLPANTLSMNGAVFAGWNTKFNGTGTAYTDGATLTINETGKLKLYAQWEGVDVAILARGQLVDLRMKVLAKSGSGSSAAEDKKIKAIRSADILPDDYDITYYKNIISDEDISPLPIYAWFDNSDGDGDGEGDGIIYIYSIATEICGGEDMYGMFYKMRHLSDISALANWNTSGTTNMSEMFYYNDDLSDISALANWDISNVKSLANMFYYNISLSDISPLANWNTSSLENITGMFMNANITNIEALRTMQHEGNDYVSWDVSNVKSMTSLFAYNTSLVDISPLASWNTSSVGSISQMFNHTAITNVDALRTMQYEGNDYVSWDVSNVSGMAHLFYFDTQLSDISALASWNTSKVTSLTYAFYHNESLTDISPLANWDTSKITDMSAMFFHVPSITNVDALRTMQHEGNDYVSWDVSSVTNMTFMFADTTSLSDISALASWNTSKVNNMSNMFTFAESLSDISALASWNTSSVTNMSNMFYRTSLANVDALRTKQHAGKDYVSWDVSSVTNMSFMFDNVTSLSDISALASWNTSSVTDMRCVFDHATSLSDISALASWDVSNVTNMYRMFYYARNISDLSPLNGWNTSSVTDMSDMFDGIPTSIARPSWYQE